MIDTLHIELTNRCNIECVMCPRTRFGIETLSDIEQMFQFSRPEVLNLILTIQERVPDLRIKNDHIIIEKENVSSFISSLDSMFADWDQKEISKDGKKEH